MLVNDTQKKFARAYEEVVFVKRIPSEVVTVAHMEGCHVEQQPIISPSPQHSSDVTLHANSETHNSSPVSAPSLPQRQDSGTQTDSPVYISTNNVPSMNINRSHTGVIPCQTIQ